jgi:hypothetical protein
VGVRAGVDGVLGEVVPGVAYGKCAAGVPALRELGVHFSVSDAGDKEVGGVGAHEAGEGGGVSVTVDGAHGGRIGAEWVGSALGGLGWFRFWRHNLGNYGRTWSIKRRW